MKRTPSKRCIRARRRGLVHDSELEIGSLLRKPGYLHMEPWQRDPIDPGAHHGVAVDIREDWPNGRVTSWSRP